MFLLYFLSPGGEEHFALSRTPTFRHEMRTERLDQPFYVKDLDAFEEAYPGARLFAKGAAWLAEDVHAQKHCAKTRVAPVVDAFLRAHAEVSLAEDDEGSGEKEGLEDEDAARSGPGAGPGAGAAATRANDANAALAPLEPASRSAAARSITASTSARSAFASLAEAANAGRDPSAIVAALEAAAEAIGTRLRGWDKKAERALAHAHRKSLEASLAAPTVENPRDPLPGDGETAEAQDGEDATDGNAQAHVAVPPAVQPVEQHAKPDGCSQEDSASPSLSEDARGVLERAQAMADVMGDDVPPVAPVPPAEDAADVLARVDMMMMDLHDDEAEHTRE